MHAKDRREWRAWLRANARASTGAWLVFFKKASGKPSVDYDEAVEEALCFGWIDTKVRALDAARYVQWFCPRKPKSAWSDSNIARVKRMIAARR